jgi:hypothetical protein
MSEPVGERARSAGEGAKRQVEKAEANPALETAGRVGWAVKGLLHLGMGGLVLGLAAGRTGATDQRGTLKLVAGLGGGTVGAVLLVCVAVALAGYALWNVICAVADPLGGDPRRSVGRRLAYLGSALAYASLLLFCLQVPLGGSAETSDRTVPRLVATLLDQPFGPWLAGAAGLAAIAAGVAQAVQGLRTSFRKDLDREEMSEAEKNVAVTLGRFGAFARGAVFVVIGWFVVQASVRRDPHQARGMGEALAALAQQPFGRGLLVLLAIGFVALALYSFAAARWLRVPGSAGRRRANGG